MKLTVTLDIPDARWFALADHADEVGMKIPTIIEAEVRAAIARLVVVPDPGNPDRGPNPYAKDRPYTDAVRREIVQRMWAAGHSSVAIGRRIGTTNLRKVRATIWALGYDPRSRIGRPINDQRIRPNNQSIPVFPPTRRGRPPKEAAA